MYIFFINLPRLSDTTLTYSGFISGCPWQCFIGSKSANSIDRGTYIMNAGTRNTCAKDTYISTTCAIDTWIKWFSIESACISDINTKSASIKDDEPRTWAGLGIILGGLKINVCCFQSLIWLILTSIEEMICWDG